MKKILAAILLSIIINLNAFALAQYVLANSIIKNEKQIEEIMLPCTSMFDEAAQNLSAIKYVQACECALKQDITSLDEQTQKDFMNTVYSIYVVNALEAHKITKEKKYLNSAFKYSKKAVENKVCNTDILKTSIMLSSFKGSPKSAARAYTQLCEVNKNECEAYYSQYDEMYNQSKVQQKENRKWIKNVGWVLLIAAAVFGGAYAGASAANNKKRSMTCHTVGTSTYCNEY